MHPNGIYGGIGSRPADEAWTPAVTEEPERKRPVPKKWRRLKLRRTRQRPMLEDETDNWPAIYVMAMFAMPIVVGLVMFLLHELGVFD